MVRAIWQDQIIAESDKTVVVEGNHYFPREDVRLDLLTPSDTHTVCPWKGTASYYTVDTGDGSTPNVDAAWYYPQPKRAAAQVTDRIAFWRGVEIVDEG
jgi:uncharacterized protein (DUF427 family)